MNIITGYRGEAHITSAQDRGKNQGAFGVDSYILNVGDKLAADIVSANEIRIRDGVLSMQGCVASIDEGAYDSCEISNGTQGMQRCDLIVARYTRNIETNIEDISLVVIEGTPASSSPSDPSYNTGDIQAGDSPVDFPLYRVNINGVNVTGTTKLAASVRTQAETDTLLGGTSVSDIGDGTITGALSALSGRITDVSSEILRTDSTGTGASGFTAFADTVTTGHMQYFRMRNGVPSSTWNYSPGFILRMTQSETVVVMFGYNVDGIALLRKKSGVWDSAWKTIALS